MRRKSLKMCNMQTRHYFLMNNLVWNFLVSRKRRISLWKKRKSSDIDVFLVRLNLKTIFTTKKKVSCAFPWILMTDFSFPLQFMPHLWTLFRCKFCWSVLMTFRNISRNFNLYFSSFQRCIVRDEILLAQDCIEETGLRLFINRHLQFEILQT